jgi:inosine-uridine nucleoside N-ribohydrolase
MAFPTLTEAARLARLEHPGRKIRMVLDTDTYNEIDDQFAVVYALLSPQQLDVEAIYAAPFFNERSSGPADGMARSYEEILRLLDRLNIAPEGLVYKGSTDYLSPDLTPQDNPAVRDLIARALASADDDPLYVVAIGAITNVASALLLEPAIVSKIVVVWLGGHALYWPHTREFNLRQDVPAARVIFDSGVPLIHVPCEGVTTHLFTTLTELDAFVRGKSRTGDYLCEIYEAYYPDHYARSKVIWDIATIAWLIDPAWVPSVIVHSPVLTDQVTWSVDQSRHFIRSATAIHRDPIFRDLFDKLKASGS